MPERRYFRIEIDDAAAWFMESSSMGRVQVQIRLSDGTRIKFRGRFDDVQTDRNGSVRLLVTEVIK